MCFDPLELFDRPRLPDPEPMAPPDTEPTPANADELARRRAARERARVTRNDLILDPSTRSAGSRTGLSLGRE